LVYYQSVAVIDCQYVYQFPDVVEYFVDVDDCLSLALFDDQTVVDHQVSDVGTATEDFFDEAVG
jgi:hypothetical protein